jgi:hypothetical protein
VEGALDDALWQAPAPSNVIEEVERVWSAIAEQDDWQPLHDHIAAICALGGALGEPPVPAGTRGHQGPQACAEASTHAPAAALKRRGRLPPATTTRRRASRAPAPAASSAKDQPRTGGVMFTSVSSWPSLMPAVGRLMA